MKSRNDTSQQNIEKKLRKGKKLTAQERRQLERARRAKHNEDDPLAAFDTDPKSDYDSSFGFGSLPYDVPAKPHKPLPHAEPKPKKREYSFDDIDYEPEPVRVSELTPKQRKIRRYLSYGAVFFLITGITLILSLTVLFGTTEIRIVTQNLPYSDRVCRAGPVITCT